MKHSIRTLYYALLTCFMAIGLYTPTVHAWGYRDAAQSSALDLSLPRHREASALAIKLSQLLGKTVHEKSQGQLIVSLLVSEPVISRLRDLLESTERADFRDAYVRYSPPSAATELNRLLLVISEIKESLPDKELQLLREMQNEQQVLPQYPGIEHPTYPTTAAIIEAAPRLAIIGVSGLLIFSVINTMRSSAKAGYAGDVAGIDQKIETAKGDMVSKLQALTTEGQARNTAIGEAEKHLRKALLSLSTLQATASDGQAQAAQVLEALAQVSNLLQQIKGAVPQEKTGGLFGRRRSKQAPKSPAKPIGSPLGSPLMRTTSSDMGSPRGTLGGRGRSASDSSLFGLPQPLKFPSDEEGTPPSSPRSGVQDSPANRFSLASVARGALVALVPSPRTPQTTPTKKKKSKK